MKSIQQSNLVYFDKDLNQWVTDSYKVYQAFNKREHRAILKVIDRIINLEFKSSLNTSEIQDFFISSTLITNRKINVKGFRLTEKGFHKVIMGLGVPRKDDVAKAVLKIHSDFINAFQEMRDLIKNDLVSFPKSKEEQLKLYKEIQSGDRVFRKACFPKANKNMKRPIKQDSELFKRIQRVSEFYFIGLEFEQDLIEFQQLANK